MKTKPTSYRFDENDLILAINKSGIKKPQKLMDFLLSEYVRDLKHEYIQLPKDFVNPITKEQLEEIAKNAAKGTNPDSKNKFDKQSVKVEEYFKIEPKMDKSEIEQRIKELESELKSPPKSPLIGLRMWRSVREQELSKLKKLI